MKNGVANEFTLPAMMPSLDSAVSFLPAIVFNLMGFELVATMTKEMKDVRDMPKAVFLSIGITAFLYIFGTVGILMALPVESIGLVSGLIDTFKTLFGGGVFGTAMVYIFGTFALLTLIGNMVSWTMGASRAAAEAAQEGELPAPVAKVSEKGFQLVQTTSQVPYQRSLSCLTHCLHKGMMICSGQYLLSLAAFSYFLICSCSRHT